MILALGKLIELPRLLVTFDVNEVGVIENGLLVVVLSLDGVHSSPELVRHPHVILVGERVVVVAIGAILIEHLHEVVPNAEVLGIAGDYHVRVPFGVRLAYLKRAIGRLVIADAKGDVDALLCQDRLNLLANPTLAAIGRHHYEDAWSFAHVPVLTSSRRASASLANDRKKLEPSISYLVPAPSYVGCRSSIPHALANETSQRVHEAEVKLTDPAWHI